MAHESTSLPSGLPGATADNYEPLPRGNSNTSILSNHPNEARETTNASSGWRRNLVILVSAALLVGLAVAAWPYLKGGVEQPSQKHQKDHKHLRVSEEASTTVSAHKHAAVVKSTSTQTTTATTTATTSQTTTTSTRTHTVRDPKLFCFTIMRSTEGEVALMREQLARGAGIYGCEEWAVFSDQKIWLSPGPPTKLDTTLIAADLNKTGDGINTKYKNSKQFLRAWEKIKEDGQHKGMDWLVKVDPDTVFFPKRLKHRLLTTNQDPSHAKFFANCRTEDHPHFMFGALELFSATAAEEFFKHGARCEKELKSEEMWEERYMGHCLRLLKVDRVDDFSLLHDGHCDLKKRPLMPCVDDEAVAFHPLRSPSEYFTCRGQAQQHWEDSQKEKDDEQKHEDKEGKRQEKKEGTKHEEEEEEEVDQEDEGKKHEVVQGKKHEVVQGKKHEVVQGKKREEAQGKQHEEAEGKQNEEAQGKKNEEVEGKKREEVEGKKREEAQGKQHEEAQGKQHEEVEGKKREEAQGNKHEEVEGNKREEAQGKQHEEVEGKKSEEVEGKKREEQKEGAKKKREEKAETAKDGESNEKGSEEAHETHEKHEAPEDAPEKKHEASSHSSKHHEEEGDEDAHDTVAKE